MFGGRPTSPRAGTSNSAQSPVARVVKAAAPSTKRVPFSDAQLEAMIESVERAQQNFRGLGISGRVTKTANFTYVFSTDINEVTGRPADRALDHASWVRTCFASARLFTAGNALGFLPQPRNVELAARLDKTLLVHHAMAVNGTLPPRERRDPMLYVSEAAQLRHKKSLKPSRGQKQELLNAWRAHHEADKKVRLVDVRLDEVISRATNAVQEIANAELLLVKPNDYENFMRAIVDVPVLPEVVQQVVELREEGTSLMVVFDHPNPKADALFTNKGERSKWLALFVPIDPSNRKVEILDSFALRESDWRVGIETSSLPRTGELETLIATSRKQLETVEDELLGEKIEVKEVVPNTWKPVLNDAITSSARSQGIEPRGLI